MNRRTDANLCGCRHRVVKGLIYQSCDLRFVDWPVCFQLMQDGGFASVKVGLFGEITVAMVIPAFRIKAWCLNSLGQK